MGKWLFLLSPASYAGAIRSSGGGASQGSHHTGRNPIIFTAAFCKVHQAWQLLSLRLLLWSYLLSWIKAIFKAGYLAQIHSTKYIYGLDLAAAAGGAEHVTETFSKNQTPHCRLEAHKHKEFSIESQAESEVGCIAAQVSSAWLEWKSPREVGNSERGLSETMYDCDIPKEGHFGEHRVGGILTSMSSSVDSKGLNQERDAHCGWWTHSWKRSQLRIWTRHHRRFSRHKWGHRDVRDTCGFMDESLHFTVFAAVDNVLRGKPCHWYVS